MHFVKVKKILSNNNGINTYRGCQHGCIYCDSRSKCYHIDHEFTDIEVKENAVSLLEEELSHKRKKVMIGTGSMCDPYMPLEVKLKMTRKCLEVIDKYHCGVHILTKSTLVLRDLDLLKRINKHSKVIVAFTITTSDEKLCKILEPNVATTKSRIRALQILHDNGIECGVWLSPFLPWINDTYDNVVELLRGAIFANVKYILCFDIGLTLREGNREYFYNQLDKSFPGLRKRYENVYGNSYMLNSSNNEVIMTMIKKICLKYHVMCDVNEIFKYINTYEARQKQLSFFD